MNERIAINGYAFRFTGRGNWRTSSDERWEIVCRPRVAGKKLGTRSIDGSLVVVLASDEGEILAILPYAAEDMR